MNESMNSRRNFLSTLAILTSGTLVAGSPANLLKGANHTLSVKERWNEFRKRFEASPYFSGTGMELSYNPAAINGHRNKAGEFLSLSNGLLVQPTWIYWGADKQEPDDVLVTFYETNNGMRKIKTINRFELDALVTMAVKKEPRQLLNILCNKDKQKAKDFIAHTYVKKTNLMQVVKLYNNKELVLKKQLFYNV
ncbi:MAG: hypothetical protein EOP46_19010 [Sphingobacteriaceae bacterium]|nr:MAG: hypothetical protein EOP46_19010 [Sphingobacteriaceae bacterium]